jgi:hypothetical protein
MSFISFAPVGFVILLAAAVGILLFRDWRWMLAALAVLYVGVFLQVAIYWPASMAVIKLVVGWMATTILGVTQLNQRETIEEHSWPAGRLFRLLTAGLMILVILSIAPKVVIWLPAAVSLPVVEGSITLIGLGFLQLGMTARPMRVIVGLLTVLAGFEILFAAIENSILVAGLLASVNLGLALVGAYLLSSNTNEEQE